MSINASLLIFSPTLQDILVDKSGTLLISGVVKLYSNTSRTFLKNWYYQSGTIAPYQYLALPNPMTLSASGTIVDVNGNDVIPGFYPFASDNTTVETYFIEVYDQYGTLIFTRYNFPIMPGGFGPTPLTGAFNVRNYIINNRFWRNLGDITIPSSGTSPATTPGALIIAPSQHDGFTMADISFNVNVLGGGDVITFQKFPNSSTPALKNDITPEFFIHHTSSATTGETYKYYQFPISLHLDSLSGIPANVTIQAKDNLGTAAQIQLFFYPYPGTGNTPPTVLPFLTITLDGVWTKYSTPSPVIIPSDSSAPIASGGDDALYLWVGMPTNQAVDLNFTLPSLYLTNEIPANDFSTYDQVNAIISTPRTGDIRTSLNSFYSWGWAPMNDGTLCNAGVVTSPAGLGFARHNVDAWPLFNLLWNSFKSYDTGINFNPICQMYSSAGALTNYGVSPIADWNALNQIQLTPLMGQVIMGTVPASALIPLYSSTFTGSGTTITIADTKDLFTGMPVRFLGTATLTVGVIYYIGVINSTTFSIHLSFLSAIQGSAPQNVDASGTFISLPTGSQEGEYRHLQLEGELAAHNHTLFNSAGAATGGLGILSSSGATNSTGITGGSVPFNVTQPSLMMNIFIKL